MVPMLLLLAAMPHHATPPRTNINTGRKNAGSMKEELAKVLEQFSSITDGYAYASSKTGALLYLQHVWGTRGLIACSRSTFHVPLYIFRYGFSVGYVGDDGESFALASGRKTTTSEGLPPNLAPGNMTINDTFILGSGTAPSPTFRAHPHLPLPSPNHPFADTCFERYPGIAHPRTGSKPYTAAGIFRLVDAGTISLDDSVVDLTVS